MDLTFSTVRRSKQSFKILVGKMVSDNLEDLDGDPSTTLK
jgi:hypothetical protein